MQQAECMFRAVHLHNAAHNVTSFQTFIIDDELTDLSFWDESAANH